MAKTKAGQQKALFSLEDKDLEVGLDKQEELKVTEDEELELKRPKCMINGVLEYMKKL